MQSIIEVDDVPIVSSERRQLLDDVIEGLSADVKTLPCKYFYDLNGSRLFDKICELDEYYPTRTETAIMRAFSEEMASAIGEECMLVEYGSGSSIKTRILLDRLPRLSCYVPIDISREHLLATADGLRGRYPYLEVLPVCADYTESLQLPQASRCAEDVVIYFPGSTIGNFHTEDAIQMLKSMAGLSQGSRMMLIGVDLQKDLSILESAYNDSAGVTAAFNKNLLVRVNRELNTEIDLDLFEHRAFFNAEMGRIEMHLVSGLDQQLWIGHHMVEMSEGESIWTESSYKYTLSGFEELARTAGWTVQQVWTDPNNWFSVQLLSAS